VIQDHLRERRVAWERDRFAIERALLAEGGDHVAKAAREVEDTRQARARRPVDSAMPDSAIRELAGLRAEHLGEWLDGIAEPMTTQALLLRLCDKVEGLDARPGAFAFTGGRPEGDQLRGFMARARCPLWWRRQLRRAVVRLRESEACQRGEVSGVARYVGGQRRAPQPYVTNDTLARHRERKASNEAMMQATELENEAGQVFTLAELAATSTANKSIRRGELMTRIQGCERLAEQAGHRGVFLTLTAPSRFHPVLRKGGKKNPKHGGETPREAHQWLCRTWARARSALARAGVNVYGFRVAEPHHDGCAHWHALLWVESQAADAALRMILKREWLKQDGDEPGAAQHRVKAVTMRPGGAAGYVAKYIAKNIDDTGAVGDEGHRDDDFEGPGQLDAFGGNHQRVEAWASCWGIRQFQAIGQPPVTVWRELRRVDEAAQAGATPRMRQAFDSVNRQGERRADWAAYVLAQGGLMMGRQYLIEVHREAIERVGRYETAEQPYPLGVRDRTQGPDPITHLSARQEWKPRERTSSKTDRLAGAVRAAANVLCVPLLADLAARAVLARPKAAQPWTRVNNCTRQGGAAYLMARLDARHLTETREPGGSTTEKDPPPCPAPLQKSPLTCAPPPRLMRLRRP
jgi:hypothetical protein